jgi:hypothetical protein
MVADVVTASLPAVEERLRRAWRKEQWFHHTRSLCVLALAAVALFLANLALDWLLVLPGYARVLLLLADLAVLGWLGSRYGWRDLCRYDPARVALRIERLYPELKSLLISYVQLNGAAPGPVHGSPRLIQAMRGQALQATAPLNFEAVVNFRDLRALFAAAAGGVLLFAASALFAGEFYRVLLTRLLNPASTLAYPTRTRIEAVTGDLTVRQGEPIVLSAQVGGEVPADGLLAVKYGEGRWETISLPRSEHSTFRHMVPRAGQSFAYAFRIGDARSEVYRVTVVPPPRILEVRIDLNFPPYTERRPEGYGSLNLPAVPEGTELRWRIRCDRPLAAGRLRVLREGVEPIPLEIDAANPHTARLTVKDAAALLGPGGPSRVELESLFYQFEWTERAHGFTFPDGMRYALEIVPDKAPTVGIRKPTLRPEQDRLLATTQKTLVLVFEAGDDYGLAEAWIAYRVNDSPEWQRRPIGRFPPGTRADLFETSWRLKDSLPDLKEGDVLTIAVEASDNRTGGTGPNRGRSKELRVQIVSVEEFLRYAEQERERGFERARGTVREEIESSKKVKALIPNEGGGP